MGLFKHIDIHKAKAMIEQEGVIFIDIRGPEVFARGHVPQAQNITDDNVEEFINVTDKKCPLICCCFHGISSQNAAQYLVQQGFQAVYSMDGGFEAWSKAYPVTSE